MSRKKIKTTKHDIVRVAGKYFLTTGYSVTSPKMISEELDISTGNITYYFPTKEHLLAEIVEMLCAYRDVALERDIDDGNSSVMAICIEFAIMVAMCEEEEILKDLYISSYSNLLTLEIIRRNDTERAKKVFKNYCPDWTDEQFVEAEILVSGIEYATLVTTGEPVSMEARIAGALNNILTIFEVPEEIRKTKIDKTLSMDYRKAGRRVLKEFRKFVERANEQAIEKLSLVNS